ncbi:MAG TPA: 16S rRNA (cytidine(1402)-2'-O)-methyltransferase [Acidimicrobiales bacterium]|nr:16S rRNA (cytidine(1402)-2'-O)-methyltransferase [Acidimicrobiales bacterium]HLN41882.1 16S rRNA (cytidine(1402)-2'-O)-methyltransferase [Acidimicrobiales bacterium]
MSGDRGAGTLVLVSTPIGNLGDLSPRALEALAQADLVCCEDTRRTRGLLTHAGLKGVRLMSLHGHNEMARVEAVLAHLAEGRTVAVVSDAGTPAVSDPGGRLVSAAAAAGATVTTVPGPSAVLAALVVSGLPTDRFCFEGFLPRRGGERRRRVEVVAGDARTAVLFEAPGRLAATLGDLLEACGPERRVVVARELTKLHEEVWRGTLAEASAAFAERDVRGEVVVVLAGDPEADRAPDDPDIVEALRARLEAGDSLRDAAGLVAGAMGVSRRRAYDLALALRRNAEP